MVQRRADGWKGVGEKAFDTELDRLLGHIMSAGPAVHPGAVTAAIARVGEAASAANYLGALRLLGDLEITIGPAPPRPQDGLVLPEDVEQALADLRRAIPRWGTADSQAAATALCSEARVAAGEGRWEAAWALIEEADARLGQTTW